MWSKWDLKLIQAYYINELFDVDGHPVHIEESPDIIWTAQRRTLRSAAVVEAEQEKLGKGKEMQDRLSKLVTIFSDLDFRGSRAEGDDLLGDAYEYLMRHFATESGKSKGQFYTPAEVSRILAKVVGIDSSTRQDQTVYDPACGSGSLLLKAAAEAPRGMTIYGQEKDNATWALSRMNMILHGNEIAEIGKGDTITNPQFTSGDHLRTFDYIVMNPPFSVKSWNNGLENDYGRFEYGRPPEKNGDYAFLLHALKSLKSNGKGNSRRLARFIQLIAADLREELAVNVRLLVALSVRHTRLVNLPQQHLGKALINLTQHLIQRFCLLGCCHWHRQDRLNRFVGFFADRRFTNRLQIPKGIQSAQTHRIVVGMLVHIVIVYVLGNVRIELTADLICLPVKDNDVDGHIVFKQKLADRINGNSERLVFRIAIDTG